MAKCIKNVAALASTTVLVQTTLVLTTLVSTAVSALMVSCCTKVFVLRRSSVLVFGAARSSSKVTPTYRTAILGELKLLI